MSSDLRIAAACIVAGLLVVVALAIGAATEPAATTVLPYVLVGGCVGTGLVAFGTALYRIERRREDTQRMEESLARVLRAAAEVTVSRDGRSE